MSFWIKAQSGRGTSLTGGQITIRSGTGTSEMDSDFIEQTTQVLKLLAQRKHPEKAVWFELAYGGYGGEGYDCYVCDQVIAFGNLRSHAEMHLKEHNLLPFL